jgi:endo-1,4-beta-D-glucanase Y
MYITGKSTLVSTAFSHYQQQLLMPFWEDCMDFYISFQGFVLDDNMSICLTAVSSQCLRFSSGNTLEDNNP